MAKKKVAPNRGKHSYSRETEEAALQLGAATAARNTALPSASDAAENTTPSSSKNTAPSSSKNTATSPSKNTGPARDKNTAPALAKNTAPASSNEDEEAVPRFASDNAENTTPSPVKNTASASAKNKDPAPAKNKASASAKNVGTAMAETLTEGSVDQDQSETRKEQRYQMYLEEMKKTEQQASPQLPEESRCQNHAYIYAKNALHRNGRDRDETDADRSIPAGPSISQQAALHTEETEADRIIHVGPSISQIVEDMQNFDPYLSDAIHKDYIKLLSRCPPNLEICAICYFERDSCCPRSHSNMSEHFRKHGPSSVKCNNCTARFLLERHRDLHGKHCNS